MTRSHAQSGFTLIEIIVAFLVFALAFASVLQIITKSMRNTARSTQFTQAALFAQSKLDSYAIEETLEEGSDAGDFDDNFSWSMDVSEYQPPILGDDTGIDYPIVLYQIDLTVEWQEGRRSAQFSTLRAHTPERI